MTDIQKIKDGAEVMSRILNILKEAELTTIERVGILEGLKFQLLNEAMELSSNASVQDIIKIIKSIKEKNAGTKDKVKESD